MKIGVIILARADYGRWPDKVLFPICGKPILEWVIEKSKLLDVDEIIVSTTLSEEDKPIREIAKSCNVIHNIGNPYSRRDRYLKAIKKYNLDYFIPISPAVPFFDVEYQNKIIKLVNNNPGFDWYSLGSGNHSAATTPIFSRHSFNIDNDPDLFITGEGLSHLSVYNWKDPEVANRYLMEFNIAYPFQAELAQKICETIGHFPNSYEEIRDVLMRVKI